MPKERNKADGYREKAYEGDTKAMNNLGVCYERGTGVKVNLSVAFEWYMKAAELGDVYGCFNVGECYYHGKGVEQNAELAFDWYLKAADKGDMQSQVIGGHRRFNTRIGIECQCALCQRSHGETGTNEKSKYLFHNVDGVFRVVALVSAKTLGE